MSHIQISELTWPEAPHQKIKCLLDDCYPLPPRDVFYKVQNTTSNHAQVWLAFNDDVLVGMIMLSLYSKGGHLENLSVSPASRSLGLGRKLVTALLQTRSTSFPSMISLTTRIPSFFKPFGFDACGELLDGSTAMVLLLPKNFTSSKFVL